MDRFVVRKSPSQTSVSFSSHKLPSTTSTTTTTNHTKHNGLAATAATSSASPGVSGRWPTQRHHRNPSGAAAHQSAQLSAAPAATAEQLSAAAASHPSARDLQLRRIFQMAGAERTEGSEGGGGNSSPAPSSPLKTLSANFNGTAGGHIRNKIGDAAAAGVFTFTGRTHCESGGSASQDASNYNRTNDQQENRPAGPPNGTMSHNKPHLKLAAAVTVGSPSKTSATVSSASAKIRAIQAMRADSPTYFDVPAAEQDIRTAEEQAAARLPPPTIRDVMRHVCVYVEVRSGSDNRSQGIKTVIAELGAAVNDRLLRNTTHVVFKDGLLSTYQKAKAWGIPVVSILWIEACRRQVCLLDPARFVISNVDRYEQPELYDKIRKQKSMQPYAEETRRRVIKPAAKATATAAADATAASSVAAAKPPARVSVPRKPKDNLPSIFGDFVKTLQQNGVDSCLAKNSKLMDIIRNSPVPGQQPSVAPGASPTSPAQRRLFRSVSTEASVSAALQATIDSSTPTRRSTRRSSMLNLSAMSMDTVTPALPTSTRRQRRQTSVFAVVSEENADEDRDDIEDAMQMSEIDRTLCISTQANTPKHATKTPRANSRRKTMAIAVNDPTNTTPRPGEKPGAVPLLNSVLRRQTMITPQTMQETRNDDAASSHAKASMPAQSTTQSARRRTLFTPSQSSDGDSERTAQRLDRLMSDTNSGSTLSSLSMNDKEHKLSTPIASSTNVAGTNGLDDLSGTPCTPVFGVAPATIFAEYSRTVGDINTTPTPFSSSRTPANAKRRTVFDMSMEIIEQRLQSINRMAAASARKNRSMSESDLNGPAEPSAVAVDAAVFGSSDSCDATMMPTTRTPSMRSLGPIIEAPSIVVPTESATIAVTALDKPKKRKLFAPSALSHFGIDEGVSASPVAAATVETDEDPGRATSNAAETKRRRDEDDAAGQQSTASKKAKTAPTVAVKTTKPKLTSAARAKASGLVSANRRRTTLDFSRAKSSTTKATAASQPAQQPIITGFLVSTNMHQEQITHIKETVRQLGGFQLEQQVTARSTHLVSLEPLRTVNFLRALIRGLWILRYEWLVDSATAGRWLPEEPYEVRDFSAAVSMCRAERQSFGARYHQNIFADLAPMFITAHCACPNLRELVVACGGIVAADMERARYVISDRPVPVRQAGHHAAAVCLRSTWILDSISIAKVKKPQAYELKVA